MSERRGLSREVKEAIYRLNVAVNKSRYRGPQRDEPMSDGYHWPMNYFEYEAIANAALALVLTVEKHDRDLVEENIR